MWLFKYLEEKFGKFDLDPATTEDNPLKTPHFFTKKDNGLCRKWFGRVFLNPPYGSEIVYWVRKSFLETKKLRNAEIVVCLLPSRTDTKWWHNYVMRSDEVYFIKGRLKFEGADSSAPFPSVIVVFKKGEVKIPKFFSLDISKIRR